MATAAVVGAIAFLAGGAREAMAEGSRGAGGAKGTRIGWPCPGCVTVVPPSYSPDAPTPLFVALHGDEGSTRVVLRLWKTSVEKRGYILLALLCPKDKGCNGSYWRWGGDPAFMLPSLDAVETEYNVDRARIYLSGWSGGSTYMGMSAPGISSRFAALNLNAGGIPPEGSSANDCNACKAPVYYFMGGKNPFTYLAERTREYYKGCGHDVVWDFGKDLDHPGELLALSKATKQEKILAWFDDKRNMCAAAAKPSASADPAAPSAASGGSPAELTSNTSVSAPPPPPTSAPDASGAADPAVRQGAGSQPGCACRGAAGAAAGSSFGAPLALAAAVSALIRGKSGRRRGRGRRFRRSRGSPGPSHNGP